MYVVYGFLLQILVALGVIILILAGIFKKKGLSLPKETKSQLKLVILAFLGIGVYSYYFSDNDIVFICRKDTMQCEYYHSTLADTELRFVESYPISAETRASSRKKTVYRGRGRSRSYYQTIFQTGEQSFPLPKDFSWEEDAVKQAGRFNTFISSDRRFYKYAEQHDEQENTETIVIFAFIFSIIIAFIFLILMLIQLFSRKTPR